MCGEFSGACIETLKVTLPNVEVTGARRQGALAARRKIDSGRIAATVHCRCASG